jgi:hypothetical protein
MILHELTQQGMQHMEPEDQYARIKFVVLLSDLMSTVMLKWHCR